MHYSFDAGVIRRTMKPQAATVIQIARRPHLLQFPVIAANKIVSNQLIGTAIVNIV